MKCFSLVLASLLLTLAASAAPAAPNIIFVLADDLGYGDVGFNGQKHIRTPNLDQMASEGLVLTDHYAGSTVCMPSRGCLMTGKHTGHATVRGNPRWTASGKPVDLSPDEVTVAQELKRAGYKTAVLGKWGLAEGDDRALPLAKGFDYFCGYRNHAEAHHYYPTQLWRNNEPFDLPDNNTAEKVGKYSHDLVIDEALAFVEREAQTKQPFFLYLALTIPHYELTVPADSKEPYQDLDWPMRKMYTGHYHNDPEGNVTYAAMVSRMDRDLGRLRALLAEKGAAENTLILFTSDNGPEFEKKDGFFNSNGPLRGGKRELYEGGIRVPTVAVWPGTIAPGRKSDHPSAFWDFLPTACELAGVDPSDDSIDGISYAPTLLGNPADQKKHDYLYWEFKERQGPMQAVRFGKWKAVRMLRGDKPIEVYNLQLDLGEKNDVADRRPDIVKQAEEIFANARTPHPEFPMEVERAKSNEGEKPREEEKDAA